MDEVVLGAAILLDYDALGRVRERAIHSVEEGNLVDDNHRVVVEYDAIGRVTEMTDVLGSFEYEYDQPGKGLSRLARVGYPNGQETLYSWHPAAGHHRLSQIRHRRSNEDLISEYGYHYGHGGQLRAWTQQVGAGALEHWVLEHDEADQLRSVVVREGGGTGTMQRQQYYSYDAGGNRTGYQEGNSVRALAYNALNQIISQPTGAPVRFEGTLDEPGTVSINNQSATLRTVLDENEAPSFRFGANLPLASGVHQVTVEARDGSGNVTEQHYEVEVGALTGQAVPEYDARGNMKSNGRGQAYEWDAANRLLAIEYADGSRTEFEYDALSRRVREVEKDEEGEVIGEKRLLWVGLGIAQERDAQNAVVKRHAGNGVALADDSKYYYTRDHLGSVRQVVDEDETVVESYSYDAYGVSVASAPGGPNGVRLADFRYTGHYHHEKSGLHLALYRAYDAELGVWISEDPIGEKGGINLYGYVDNGPMAAVDLLGLETLIIIHRGAPAPGQQERDACGVMHVFHDGEYIFSTHTNKYGYQNGHHGIYPGTYSILPRTDADSSSVYDNGTPAVTAKGQSNPGNAGHGYRNVYIHPEANIKGGDSRGCVTVPDAAASKIKEFMDSDQARGHKTIMKIFNFKGVPYAWPVH